MKKLVVAFVCILLSSAAWALDKVAVIDTQAEDLNKAVIGMITE